MITRLESELIQLDLERRLFIDKSLDETGVMALHPMREDSKRWFRLFLAKFGDRLSDSFDLDLTFAGYISAAWWDEKDRLCTVIFNNEKSAVERTRFGK